MATISLTNARVNRKFFQDKGLEVVETFRKQSGEMGERKFTAWFEDPQDIEVNAVIDISGTLVATIELWEDRDKNPVIDKRTGKQGQSVAIKINDAQITKRANAIQYETRTYDQTVIPF
jgi:hypothetical protein